MKKYDIQKVKKAIDWLIFDKIVETRRELAEKLGYTESSLSQIINGKVGLSERFINKLLIFDDRLNPEWFSTDNAPMLNCPKNPFSQMTEREIGESVSEVIMDMYTKGEIYPASIYDKAIAEKNKELSARDQRIEELQREVWEWMKKVDELSK